LFMHIPSRVGDQPFARLHRFAGDMYAE